MADIFRGVWILCCALVVFIIVTAVSNPVAGMLFGVQLSATASKVIGFISACAYVGSK